MTYDSAEDLANRYGPSYRWLVTITGMIGIVAMVLAMTTVNVAVPDVMGAFGIGQDKAQWMSSAYMATMTAGMLLSAWVVSVLGERRTFIGAQMLFSFGAVLGGSAPNEDMLILARVLQGFCGGVAQPLVMAIIFSSFPPERRGSAMGVFGLGVVFAPAIGPTLGGLMIEFFSWRYVFFIALPFCLVAAVMAMFFMPSRPFPKEMPKFDWLGFALLGTGLYGLMVGLANGQREGWDSNIILIELSIGATAAVGFVLWQLKTDKPLLEIRMFAGGQFAAAATVAFIFGAGMMGSTYLIPVFVQTTLGFTPLDAGMMMMPAGLMLAFIFPAAGRLSDILPAGLMIFGGLMLFALGFVIMAGADANTTFWTMAGVTMISRLGLGLINPTLNAASLRAVAPELVRQSAGAANFMRQLGGAFGINLMVVLLELRIRFHADALTATQDFANATTERMLRQLEKLFAKAGLPHEVQKSAALDYLGQIIHGQSSTLAFQDTFIIIAGVAIAALLPAYVLSRAQRQGNKPAGAPAPRPA